MVQEKVLTVFIVEDQPIVKTGLTFMLQELPNVCVIGDASDGMTAVAKVLDLRPDLVLMDISLPELDGISATKMIKEKWPEAKILILTTHENDHYIFAGLTAGADGYCLKNTNEEQLALAIDVIRKGTVWLDPGIAQRVLRSCGQLEEPAKKTTPPKEEPKKKDFNLLPDEFQVLRMMVEGVPNAEMAERLMTDEDAIRKHIRSIVAKLAVADRTQAAITALKEGIVSMDSVTWRILRDARHVDPDS